MSPNITIPKNASKDERKAAIEAAAKAKKEQVAKEVSSFNGNGATKPKVKVGAKPDTKAPVKEEAKPKEATPTKDAPAKKAKDPNVLTVSDVARECKLDPKVARSRLRRHGLNGATRATEGRWPTVVRDSKEHKALVAVIMTEEPKKDKVVKKAKEAPVEDSVKDDVDDEDDESEDDEDEESDEDE